MGSQLVVFGAVVAIAGTFQLLVLRPWAKFASGLLQSLLPGDHPGLESQVRVVGRWILTAIVAVGVIVVAIGVVSLANGTESV
jgi:hypothetical protein